LTFSLPGRPELGSPSLDLKAAGSGTWSGQGTVLSMDGTWTVTALVQEAGGAVEVPLRLTTRLPPEKVEIQRATGQPDLYTISLTGGKTLQTYIDPGRRGPNVVHFTFFRPGGQEQPVASARATALTPSGSTMDISLIRFDRGHFASNTTLSPGSWRFQIVATLSDGTQLSGYFSQRIGST
ncbi:MAG TPA: hypothetical protein VJO72_12505, partial [Candidatus Dormibacteraeota bacterium]|nr:hypothetical protein [Candidatus Dormibacteraeota bacterium]